MHIKDFLKRMKRHIVWGQSKTSPSVSRHLSITIDNKILGSDITGEWSKFKSNILKDFYKNPAGFLREKNIQSILHPNQQRLSEAYFLEMTQDPFVKKSIMPLLYDIPLGDPYFSDCFPPASPLSLQHAYYYYMMNKYLDNFLVKDNGLIVEFGGGYGNFCRLSYNFGYTGHYAIIDFPELQQIQHHFLSYPLQQRIETETIKFYPSINEDIFKGQNSKHPVLFVGTYSLAETQIETRQEVELYYDKFDYIFLTYGSNFDGVDNLTYFENLKNKLSNNFDIQIMPDKHAKNCYFFLGKKK